MDSVRGLAVAQTSAATKRRDRKLRENKGDYVDPARYRGAKKNKLFKKAKTIPKTKRSKKEPFTNLQVYRPEEGESKTYTSQEKFGIMQVALATSVEEAATEFHCSTISIYKWFKEVGGIREIREYVSSKAGITLYKAITTFLEDLDRRLEEASEEEYFETFRKLLSVMRESGLSVNQGESDGNPGHPQGTGITLNFNPPGSNPEGNDAPEGNPRVSVFDE